MIAPSKIEFLARHRTLHVNHVRVTDPLFEVGGFFDPRDLLLVKYETLRRAAWTAGRPPAPRRCPARRGTTRSVAGSDADWPA